ncbi:probable phosphoglycerate mutase Pmu1p [[Candida] railenensis]|uniref:Probable phosphoglycerate mutase Pmu1p n=1 Tax=[Candida] railenensis TaxID=45579 RepID=A0A9P0VW12_9ASCO|nr:probable phosphoglycerate mutase Pmu1p [[Candida] railenensis]
MVSNIDVIDSKVQTSQIEGYKILLEQFHLESNMHWRFETVQHIFKQSSNETDDTKFDYLKENFGIEVSWDEINDKLVKLNNKAEENEVYKVLFLARHGEGYHNVAHEKYGNDAWNEYWSKLNGDDEMIWGPDAELTQKGRGQAKDNWREWERQIKGANAPIPTKFYSSPLSRSIDTLILTWEKIVDLARLKPLIKEKIRETIGVHTCDKRSSKSILQSKYSELGFQFEADFAEEDIYFKPNVRESVSEHALRLNKAFQEIFNENGKENPYICITSHSGTIRASLLALGHREFSVGTGGMIPVFVKATRGDRINKSKV